MQRHTTPVATEETEALPGLLGALGFKRKVKVDPDPDQTAIAQDQLKAKALRAMQKKQAKIGRPGRGDGWPAGPKWAPRRTGQPPWFKSMKFKAERQRLLLKVPTKSLVEHHKNIRLVQDYYPNVWALSQATYEDLLALPGVGPAKLKELRAFLSSRNVACAWRVA